MYLFLNDKVKSATGLAPSTRVLHYKVRGNESSLTRNVQFGKLYIYFILLRQYNKRWYLMLAKTYHPKLPYNMWSTHNTALFIYKDYLNSERCQVNVALKINGIKSKESQPKNR